MSEDVSGFEIQTLVGHVFSEILRGKNHFVELVNENHLKINNELFLYVTQQVGLKSSARGVFSQSDSHRGKSDHSESSSIRFIVPEY